MPLVNALRNTIERRAAASMYLSSVLISYLLDTSHTELVKAFIESGVVYTDFSKLHKLPQEEKEGLRSILDQMYRTADGEERTGIRELLRQIYRTG